MSDSSLRSYFGVIDYVTVGLTLVISLGIGVYHAVRGGGKETSEDLLMGGRSMKTIPVAASMLVTYFSAIAIIGYPAEIYTHGIQIFWMDLFLIIFCIPLSTFLFITVLYELKLTSAYEYLEYRFNSVFVRCLASAIFILEGTFMTGVALFAPSIVLEAFLGVPQWASIVGIGICGTFYTSIGGLKAVVWTDVFQFFLIIIGMLAIVVQGFTTVGGINEAFTRAYDHGRLKLFNWNVDPFERYNTLNFVLGYGLTVVCFFGTHQPNVQRYSSLPSLSAAIKAMAWNAVFKELTNVLIILTGVSVFAMYATCDPIRLGEIKTADEIVPYFFVKEVSWIPGMMGLFTSCILSAVLSTLSSSLNSLAAVTWEDFFSRIPFFQSMSTVHKGRVTCLLSALYGMVTIGLAFIVGQLGSIFQVTITIIGAFGGALGGAFIMGMFFPCVNKVGAAVGMLTGLFSTGFLTYQAYLLQITYSTLPTSVVGCPANSTLLDEVINSENVNFTWPTKLFTVSYILYPFIGTFITVITGLIVSGVSVFFIQKPPTSCSNYVHPIIKHLFCSPRAAPSSVVKAKLSKNCH